MAAAKKTQSAAPAKSPGPVDVNAYLEYVKGVVTAPAKLLPKFLAEKKSLTDLFMMTGVVGLLTFVGVLVGDFIAGYNVFGIGFVFQHALFVYLGAVLGPIVGTFVFSSLDKSILKLNYSTEEWGKIMVFTTLPYLAAGIAYVLLGLGSLVQGIAGLYSLYLFYTALATIKKVPQDVVIKTIVLAIIAIGLVQYIFASYLVNQALASVVGNPLVWQALLYP